MTYLIDKFEIVTDNNVNVYPVLNGAENTEGVYQAANQQNTVRILLKTHDITDFDEIREKAQIWQDIKIKYNGEMFTITPYQISSAYQHRNGYTLEIDGYIKESIIIEIDNKQSPIQQ